MFLQFRFEKLVNRWVLILILDLMASFLLADSFGSPPRLVESVEASGHGEITGGSGSRVEVLMNAVVPGHNHHRSLLPSSDPWFCTFLPKQGVTAGTSEQ